MATEGFHCPGCDFRCVNPSHVHHACLATADNVLVTPHDHSHEGCVTPTDEIPANPYRALADDLAALPEGERMLLSVKFRGTTSDTGKPCGCFYGSVLPAAVRNSLTSFHTNNAFHTSARFRSWVRSKGFTVHRGDRYAEEDSPLVRILHDIQSENDCAVATTASDRVSNTEENARLRYGHMLAYLRKNADAWDGGRRRP